MADEPVGRRVERELCATGKVMFPKKVEALTAANFRMAKGADPLRVYECDVCAHWHLTREKRERR